MCLTYTNNIHHEVLLVTTNHHQQSEPALTLINQYPPFWLCLPKKCVHKILETRKHTFFSATSVRKVGFQSPCFQFSTLRVFFSDCCLVKTHQDHWFLPSDCQKSGVCSKMMVLPPFSIGVPLKNHPSFTLTLGTMDHTAPAPGVDGLSTTGVVETQHAQLGLVQWEA